MVVGSEGFSMVQMERPHRPPKNKMPKSGPTKQSIALFLYSSIMTVAPCLHLNFRTKVGMYSIDSEDLFLEITTFWDENQDFG